MINLDKEWLCGIHLIYFKIFLKIFLLSVITYESIKASWLSYLNQHGWIPEIKKLLSPKNVMFLPKLSLQDIETTLLIILYFVFQLVDTGNLPRSESLLLNREDSIQTFQRVTAERLSKRSQSDKECHPHVICMAAPGTANI